MTNRPVLPLHIDSTMMTCFRSCPQKFYLEFVCGFRPPGISIDLHAGACFATGLEATYKALHMDKLSLPKALEKGLGAFLTAWGDFEIPEWKRTAKTADRMWEAISNPMGDEKNKGYFDVYAPLTDPVQPYFDSQGHPTFEYTFAIPLEPIRIGGGTLGSVRGGKDTYDAAGEEDMCFPCHPSGSPFIYTGRFDMLGSYGGRPIVRDEKSTGASIGQRWAEQWDLRSQFMGYVWACRECGIDVDQVCVRGISIQKTQIVHAEAFKQYSNFMIARWYEQLRRDLWRLRRQYDEGYFDFNLGDACTAYGNCMFQNVCQSPNVESWTSEFVVRHWNPLEKNPVKEDTK